MVGRVEESAALEAAYSADESEFVAVYGRRRVGKTYLVSESSNAAKSSLDIGRFVYGVIVFV